MPDEQGGIPATPATPAGNAGAAPATPAATGGTPVASTENMVPQSRLNEMAEQKRQSQARAEEAERRIAEMEATNAAREAAGKPPVEETPDDIYGDANKFVEKRVDSKTEPLRQKIDRMEKEGLQEKITKAYNASASMKELYKTEHELISAIAKTAVKYGAKELTPEAIQFAYDKLKADNWEELERVSMEIGVKTEREKSRILSDVGAPTGPGSSSATKGIKVSEDQKKIWKKFGWDDKKIAEKAAGAYVDEDGKVHFARGGK